MSTRPGYCRPTAVAGLFYPGVRENLACEIADFLASDPPGSTAVDSFPKAIIVPHAGYIYSGRIAAKAFSLLTPLRGKIRRVILLGPAHRVAVRGLALPTSETFATPLGRVPIDQQSASVIEKFPQIILDDAAHADEHSLEVQIPFLQHVLGNFLLLPLAVGRVSPEAVAEVLGCLWGGKETLIVISSDLSHFLSYEAAQTIDSKTARQILALDPTIDPHQACGAVAVNGLLLFAQKRGLRAQQLDLCNSGDTAGDRARVVGYGAFAFFEPEQESEPCQSIRSAKPC